MKYSTIIVKTLSKHIITIILQVLVKNVVFEQKQFHLSNPLFFFQEQE